ncbi:MAG: hypothetical protein QM627_00100 [Luteolibacter sp.]
MIERPILFSAPMVVALLEGRKTQTRRIIKGDPFVVEVDYLKHNFDFDGNQSVEKTGEGKIIYTKKGVTACPYGKVGDRLWVKETWKTDQVWDHLPPRGIPEDQSIYFCADEDATGCVPFDWGKSRPSIFMRRWMSRITLEIVSIRVERLHEISEEDVIAEGVDPCEALLGSDDIMVGAVADNYQVSKPKARFILLWNKINGEKHSFESNPFVWVIEFKRVERGDA